MPFEIVRNDITQMRVDVIVNAANSQLMRGGGVCGAIFAAAGAEKLQKACDEIGHCEVGDAVITPAFELPMKYIIHTVGPMYREWEKEIQAKQLYNCYKNSLELAEKNGAESMAFPLISSGIYGYPKREALSIATSAIKDYLENSDMTVYLVMYDRN